LRLRADTQGAKRQRGERSAQLSRHSCLPSGSPRGRSATRCQTAFQNYQSASLLDVFEFDASARTEACASLLDAHLILNASQRERKLSEPVT